jgi:hypothetical protein
MRNLTGKLKNMWRRVAPRGDMKLLIQKTIIGLEQPKK